MARLPFILARQSECAAIDRAIKDPGKRQALYDIIDAVLRVNQTQKITPLELAPIIAAFHFTAEPVWSRAASWLAKLHAYDPTTVTPILDQLSTDPSITPRLNLCRSLDRFPTHAALPLLRRYLSDKSARVQDSALGIAMKKRITELLPDLQARLQIETKPDRAQDFQEAINWLQGSACTLKGLPVRQLPNGDIESV
ncbi:MAG TPA: HEAT repeat domain-containing protein [Verrucomicrobiae bacterium]|nr:HEAT repeat domain-containing protein [Verrucomicrobiae bacterium]